MSKPVCLLSVIALLVCLAACAAGKVWEVVLPEDVAADLADDAQHGVVGHPVEFADELREQLRAPADDGLDRKAIRPP